MAIRLESDNSASFSITGEQGVKTTYQRGKYRPVINGPNVGLAEIGYTINIVAPTHFSEWEDATNTPYPTLEDLLTDIGQNVFIRIFTSEEVFDLVAYREITQTGRVSGGAVSVKDADEITISAGEAIVINSYTDPLNPVYSPIAWPDTDIVITDLTEPITRISITDTGAFIQVTEPFSPSQLRNTVILAIVYIDTVNNTVISADTAGVSVNNLTELLFDFLRATNPIRIIEGIEFSIASGNSSQLQYSAGSVFTPGINIVADPGNPNTRDIPAADPTPFDYIDSTGGGYDTSDLIDPDNYDPNNDGTILATPAGEFTNQLVLILPGSRVLVQYGQKSYATQSAATQNLFSDSLSFIIEDSIRNAAVQRLWVTIQEGDPDLNNAILTPIGQAAASGGGAQISDLIQDGDTDTRVETESTTDDDTIRHFTATEEAFRQVPGGDSFFGAIAADLDQMEANLTRKGKVNVMGKTGEGTGVTVMRHTASFRVGYGIADQNGQYRSSLILNGDNLQLRHGAGAGDPDGNIAVAEVNVNSNLTLGRNANVLLTDLDWAIFGIDQRTRINGSSDAIGSSEQGASIGQAASSGQEFLVFGAGDVRIDIDENGNESNRKFHVTKDNGAEYLLSIGEEQGMILNAPLGNTNVGTRAGIRVYDPDNNAGDNSFRGHIEWYDQAGTRVMYMGQASVSNQDMIILNDVGDNTTELVLQQDGNGAVKIQAGLKGRTGGFNPAFSVNTRGYTHIRWLSGALLRRDTPQNEAETGDIKFTGNRSGGSVTIQGGYGQSGSSWGFSTSHTIGNGNGFGYAWETASNYWILFGHNL